MKFGSFKKVSLAFSLLAAVLAGCGQPSSTDPAGSSSSTATASIYGEAASGVSSESNLVGIAANVPPAGEFGNREADAAELEVQFGDDGSFFVLRLEDNETAAAIARHVGTADWRLPIYHYDDYENWEAMQYYDIPSRYDIPSNPETVTSEKAGEVYYSAPNRIVLFYQDAEVSGEYTKVGSFHFTEEFQSAVENNPVLEGWGNKIVIIRSGNK